MSESNFYQDVYQLVKLIPRGKVTTYGAIAKYLGLKSSARMVGWALNQSIAQNDVPAHRVVNRNGRLTGKMHFASSVRMQELLELENIKVENDQVVNFDGHFWDPSKELEL
jgi:methylated-DNA-protein-cysteine methyltransferase-like protein